MNIKKLLFFAVIVSFISVLFGLFMRLGISELSQIEKQTFVILLTAKEILLVAFYIAWRVTPEPKQ